MSKPKLGIIGDFSECGSGFGEVTKNLIANLKQKYQITHLAINYMGDFHEIQREIRLYMCGGEKDPYGFSRVKGFIAKEQPDIILIVNDPWLAPRYINTLKELDATLPVVLYTPVDSNGLDYSYVNQLNLFTRIVAYTEYGKQELQYAGLTQECSVIPHGVDTTTFYPVDRNQARANLDFAESLRNKFIVGYLGQNQPRKKVDHFVWIINEWMRKYPHADVAFYYHGPIARKGGINVLQYVEYLHKQNERLGYTFNFADMFLTTSDNPNFMAPRDMLRDIIGSWDVFLQSAASEGWGMGLHQAMAMKLPSIVPEYSALAEWPINGVHHIPVLDTPNIYESGINTDHKVFDPYWAVEALEYLYQNEQARNDLANRGYEVAIQPKFNWVNIAQQFDNIFTELLRKEYSNE